MESLICVYCGKTTSKNEDLEHVIPEALGCKETLYAGAVCTKCNLDLGSSFDNKVFHEPLMAFGQVASGAEGKSGARTKIHSKLGTTEKIEGGASMSNTVSGSPNQYWVSRCMAKAAVNILTYNLGSDQVRKDHPDLLRYVRMPKNRREIWPFTAIYSPLRRNVVFGLGLKRRRIRIRKRDLNYSWFVCASGLFGIPFERESEEALSAAREYLQETIRQMKAQGAELGFTAVYDAKSNNGA